METSPVCYLLFQHPRVTPKIVDRVDRQIAAPNSGFFVSWGCDGIEADNPPSCACEDLRSPVWTPGITGS
jgi:hypothetical protein